jgi:hypothetical protein
MQQTFRMIQNYFKEISQNELYAVTKQNLYKISPLFVSTYSFACYLRRTLRCPVCGEVYLSDAAFTAARGRPRWGVVQPVGHLTVNEDGEGSNPSAPANFSSEYPANNGR